MVEIDVPLSGSIRPSGTLPQSGTSFSDVFNTFRGVPEIPSYDPFSLRATGQQISDFFSNFFDRIVKPTGADYGNAKGGVTTKTGISTGTKVLVGGGLATTSIGLVSLTATNPDLNKTLQTNAGALSSLANTLSTTARTTESFTNFVTQNPLILIAIMGLGALVILKK